MPVSPRTLDIDESHVLQTGDLPAFISRQVLSARRFYFALTTKTGAKLHVALGGWERVNPDYSIRRPRFSYHSIEFVTEGKGRVTLAGQSHALEPGAIFGYGPACPLEISTDDREPLTKYYITFAGSSAKEILRSAGMAPFGFKHIAARHQVQDIFETILTNGMSHTRFSQRICGLMLSALSVKVAEQSVPQQVRNSARAYNTYLQVRKILDRDYLQLRSVEDVAQQCKLTVPYICQVFKRFGHITPYQHLMRQRMQYAADLLSDPNVLIKQIARRLDFADQFQFSRAFKRVLGISPEEFRRSLLRVDTSG